MKIQLVAAVIASSGLVMGCGAMSPEEIQEAGEALTSNNVGSTHHGVQVEPDNRLVMCTPTPYPWPHEDYWVQYDCEGWNEAQLQFACTMEGFSPYQACANADFGSWDCTDYTAYADGLCMHDTGGWCQLTCWATCGEYVW